MPNMCTITNRDRLSLLRFRYRSIACFHHSFHHLVYVQSYDIQVTINATFTPYNTPATSAVRLCECGSVPIRYQLAAQALIPYTRGRKLPRNIQQSCVQ